MAGNLCNMWWGTKPSQISRSGIWWPSSFVDGEDDDVIGEIEVRWVHMELLNSGVEERTREKGIVVRGLLQEKGNFHEWTCNSSISVEEEDMEGRRIEDELI